MKERKGVSLETIREIIQTSPEQVIPHLISLINTGDADQVQFAGDLLGEFGESAIKTIDKKSEKRKRIDEQKLVLHLVFGKNGTSRCSCPY